MDGSRSSLGHRYEAFEPVLDASSAGELANRLRTPLTPMVGLLEVFLRRWGDELTTAQAGLLRRVDREGRRVLADLDEVADATVRPEGGAGGVPRLTPAGSATVAVAGAGVSGSPTLEDRVSSTVAELLRAEGAEAMLTSLSELVEACGGRVGEPASDALRSIRALPDGMRVPDGREMTLGPVLRALAAAALESASGELAPPRRWEREAALAPGPGRETLVALDLGTLGAVRAEFGDPGARWLVEKLRRTLRSQLGGQDRALRYPASRFLVLLADSSESQGHQFSRRVAWEWNAYLGRRLHVRTQVEPVAGELTDALRRLSFSE